MYIPIQPASTGLGWVMWNALVAIVQAHIITTVTGEPYSPSVISERRRRRENELARHASRRAQRKTVRPLKHGRRTLLGDSIANSAPLSDYAFLPA